MALPLRRSIRRVSWLGDSSGTVCGRTGAHRYVWLVYKQSGPVTNANIGPITSPTDNARDAFNMNAFATANRLGNPIAGNYFLDQFGQ